MDKRQDFESMIFLRTNGKRVAAKILVMPLYRERDVLLISKLRSRL